MNRGRIRPTFIDDEAAARKVNEFSTIPELLCYAEGTFEAVFEHLARAYEHDDDEAACRAISLGRAWKWAVDHRKAEIEDDLKAAIELDR